ncbi:hypothetical protein J6590_015072 [Homalodisca vitripennis]|nr:hypothetical protein J6590_015072 [Homalodisca vitripennis]
MLTDRDRQTEMKCVQPLVVGLAKTHSLTSIKIFYYEEKCLKNVDLDSHADMKNWYSPIMMERFGRGVVISWRGQQHQKPPQRVRGRSRGRDSKSDVRECQCLCSCAGKIF